MPMFMGQGTPNRYFIESLTISNNSGVQEEIVEIFEEFVITESIYQNFVTGFIKITDGANFFNRIGFTGQEYIRIHLAGVEKGDDKVPYDEHIDLVFRIYKVTDMTKEGNTTGYRLHFVTPEALKAHRHRISRAYNGTISDICAKIMKEELGIRDDSNKKPDGKYTGTRMPSEGNIQCIIPNWTISETLNRLVARASTEEGITPNSYYMYQTAGKGYKLNKIEDMYQLKYLGGDAVMGEALAGTGDMQGAYDSDGTDGQRPGPGTDIYDINKPNMFDVIENTKKGVYSGKRITMNPINKIYQEIPFRIADADEWDMDSKGEYKTKGHISKSLPFRVAPEVVRLPSDGAVVGEALELASQSESLDSIIDYTDAALDFGYETPMNINGKDTTINNLHHKTQLGNFKRQSVRQLLTTNTVNVAISGRTNISCGQTIKLDLKQPIESGGVVEDEFMHNGEFLIVGCSFLGTQDSLIVQLELAKDGLESSMDGFQTPTAIVG